MTTFRILNPSSPVIFNRKTSLIMPVTIPNKLTTSFPICILRWNVDATVANPAKMAAVYKIRIQFIANNWRRWNNRLANLDRLNNHWTANLAWRGWCTVLLNCQYVERFCFSSWPIGLFISRVHPFHVVLSDVHFANPPKAELAAWSLQKCLRDCPPAINAS